MATESQYKNSFLPPMMTGYDTIGCIMGTINFFWGTNFNAQNLHQLSLFFSQGEKSTLKNLPLGEGANILDRLGFTVSTYGENTLSQKNNKRLTSHKDTSPKQVFETYTYKDDELFLVAVNNSILHQKSTSPPNEPPHTVIIKGISEHTANIYDPGPIYCQNETIEISQIIQSIKDVENPVILHIANPKNEVQI